MSLTIQTSIKAWLSKQRHVGVTSSNQAHYISPSNSHKYLLFVNTDKTNVAFWIQIGNCLRVYDWIIIAVIIIANF